MMVLTEMNDGDGQWTYVGPQSFSKIAHWIEKNISRQGVIHKETATKQFTSHTDNLVARYRQFAATLEHEAADKHADRLANTPKRALQATQARIIGDALARASKALTALADGLEAGTL